MKIAKIILPLLIIAAAPTAADAATQYSSEMSLLHGWIVIPTSWFYGVGLYR